MRKPPESQARLLAPQANKTHASKGRCFDTAMATIGLRSSFKQKTCSACHRFQPERSNFTDSCSISPSARDCASRLASKKSGTLQKNDRTRVLTSGTETQCSKQLQDSCPRSTVACKCDKPRAQCNTYTHPVVINKKIKVERPLHNAV